MKVNEKTERKFVAWQQDSIPTPQTGIICKLFLRDYLLSPTWLTVITNSSASRWNQ